MADSWADKRREGRASTTPVTIAPAPTNYGGNIQQLSETYQVDAEDVIGGPTKLAEKLNVTTEDLLATNGVDSLSQGQYLTLPGTRRAGGMMDVTKGEKTQFGWTPQLQGAIDFGKSFISAAKTVYGPSGTGGADAQSDLLAESERRKQDLGYTKPFEQPTGVSDTVKRQRGNVNLARETSATNQLIAEQNIQRDLITKMTGILQTDSLEDQKAYRVSSGYTRVRGSMPESFSPLEVRIMQKALRDPDSAFARTMANRAEMNAGAGPDLLAILNAGYDVTPEKGLVQKAPATPPENKDFMINHNGGVFVRRYKQGGGYGWVRQRKARDWDVTPPPPPPPANYDSRSTVLNLMLRSG